MAQQRAVVLLVAMLRAHIIYVLYKKRRAEAALYALYPERVVERERMRVRDNLAAHVDYGDVYVQLLRHRIHDRVQPLAIHDHFHHAHPQALGLVFMAQQLLGSRHRIRQFIRFELRPAALSRIEFVGTVSAPQKVFSKRAGVHAAQIIRPRQRIFTGYFPGIRLINVIHIAVFHNLL